MDAPPLTPAADIDILPTPAALYLDDEPTVALAFHLHDLECAEVCR